jgi:hypothetical protein
VRQIARKVCSAIYLYIGIPFIWNRFLGSLNVYKFGRWPDGIFNNQFFLIILFVIIFLAELCETDGWWFAVQYLQIGIPFISYLPCSSAHFAGYEGGGTLFALSCREGITPAVLAMTHTEKIHTKL